MGRQGRLKRAAERREVKRTNKQKQKLTAQYLRKGPKPKLTRAPAMAAEKPEAEPKQPVNLFHPFVTKPSSRSTEPLHGIAAPKRFEDMHPYDMALMLISSNPKFRDRANDPVSLSVEIGRGQHAEAVQRLRRVLGEK